jgi:hypothetical protein
MVPMIWPLHPLRRDRAEEAVLLFTAPQLPVPVRTSTRELTHKCAHHTLHQYSRAYPQMCTPHIAPVLTSSPTNVHTTHCTSTHELTHKSAHHPLHQINHELIHKRAQHPRVSVSRLHGPHPGCVQTTKPHSHLCLIPHGKLDSVSLTPT